MLVRPRSAYGFLERDFGKTEDGIDCNASCCESLYALHRYKQVVVFFAPAGAVGAVARGERRGAERNPG